MPYLPPGGTASFSMGSGQRIKLAMPLAPLRVKSIRSATIRWRCHPVTTRCARQCLPNITPKRFRTAVFVLTDAHVFFSHTPYAVPFSESKSSPSPTEWTWRTFIFRKTRGERGGRLGLHAPHPPAHPFPLPGEGLTSATPSQPRCRGGPCRRCRFRASSRAVRVRRSTRFRRHSRQ